jgi:hypothetical protein
MHHTNDNSAVLVISVVKRTTSWAPDCCRPHQYYGPRCQWRVFAALVAVSISWLKTIHPCSNHPRHSPIYNIRTEMAFQRYPSGAAGNEPTLTPHTQLTSRLAGCLAHAPWAASAPSTCSARSSPDSS